MTDYGDDERIPRRHVRACHPENGCVCGLDEYENDQRETAEILRDRDALDRIAALLCSGADLDGSDAGESLAAIVAGTGRAVTA